jgi:hypothetical protein
MALANAPAYYDTATITDFNSYKVALGQLLFRAKDIEPLLMFFLLL